MSPDERGLTLIEVLVAAGIFGVGLLALMDLVPISTYGLHEGAQLSTATFLAEQKLEEVRAARWSTTPAIDCLGLSLGSTEAPTSTTCSRQGPTPCTTGAACEISPDEPAIAGHPAFARTVRIGTCAALPGGCGGVTSLALRQVTVAVSYRPLTGASTLAGSAKPVVLVMNVARR
jgi:prepilin-type N-terminal cleavage/methylation domain-containing protein